jgi:hypothetical protein
MSSAVECPASRAHAECVSLSKGPILEAAAILQTLDKLLLGDLSGGI